MSDQNTQAEHVETSAAAPAAEPAAAPAVEPAAEAPAAPAAEDRPETEPEAAARRGVESVLERSRWDLEGLVLPNDDVDGGPAEVRCASRETMFRHCWGVYRRVWDAAVAWGDGGRAAEPDERVARGILDAWLATQPAHREL